ncbi:GP4 protein [Mikumi yellow baboon virus 1]|uniref:GP4 protein n=1 Tax=Mikumi yellow baboon virus 1 TaxID=1546177 RepID=A0A089G0C7_9NIDO|nr:GP4 protein [Mikumi yellow baboon virus 1]AIP91227.1 GP4 protein [Mikumi yellow baboon virus 1]
MSPLQLFFPALLVLTGLIRPLLGNNTSTATPATTTHNPTTKSISFASPMEGTCYQCCHSIVNGTVMNVSVSYVYHQNCKLHALDHLERINVTTNSSYCMHDCWLNALKKVYQGYNVTINQTHFCYKPYSTREFTPAVTKWATAIVVFVKLTQFLQNNE